MRDPFNRFALRYLAAVVCGLALLLLHSTAQSGLPAAFVPQCPSPWELSKLAFWPLLAAWVLTGRAGQGAPHAAAGSAGSGADAPGYDSGVLGLGGRRGKRRGEPGGLGGAAGGGHGLLPGRKKAPGAVGSPGSASGGAVHAADLHASGLGTIRQSAGMREDLLSRPSVVQYGRCIQENAASPGLPAGGHEEELRYERHRHRRGAG